MTRTEHARHLFSNGYSCSQAVLLAFADDLNLDEETAAKIASGFSGGMRCGETCGAFTGALMVLGMLYGHNNPSQRKQKDRAYEIVQIFTKKFIEKHGSRFCKELIRFDISREDGYKSAKSSGAFRDVCPDLVASAVDLIEEIAKNDSPDSWKAH